MIPAELKAALFIGPLFAVSIFAGFEHHEAAHWQGKYTGLQASVEIATAKATENATAAKLAADTKTTAAKEASDNALDTATTDGARQLADYIRLHRFTPARPASGGDLPAAPTTPEVDNGSGPTIAVDETVLATCTTLNVRLNNAHAWGDALATTP